MPKDNNYKISITYSIIDPLKFIGKNFTVIVLYIIFAGLILSGVELILSKVIFNNFYYQLPFFDFFKNNNLSILSAITAGQENTSNLLAIQLQNYSYKLDSIFQLLNVLLSTPVLVILAKSIFQILLAFIIQVLVISPLLLLSYKNYINFGNLPNISLLTFRDKNLWRFVIKSIQIMLIFVFASLGFFILFCLFLAILIKLTASLFIFFIPLVILIIIFIPFLIVVYFRANFILPAIASNKKMSIMEAYNIGKGANLHIFFVSIMTFITLALIDSVLHYSLETLFSILHTPKNIVYLYNSKVISLFSQIFFGLVFTSVFCQLHLNNETTK